MRKFWSTMLVLAVVGVIGVSSAFADDAPKKGEKKRERPSLEQIFKKLDADNDGNLTVAELAKSPRLKGDEAKAKEILAKMKGEDDKVTCEEFCNHIKKMHAKHHKHGEHKKGEAKKGEHKKGEHKKGERKKGERKEKECKKGEAKK